MQIDFWLSWLFSFPGWSPLHATSTRKLSTRKLVRNESNADTNNFLKLFARLQSDIHLDQASN